VYSLIQKVHSSFFIGYLVFGMAKLVKYNIITVKVLRQKRLVHVINQNKRIIDFFKKPLYFKISDA